MSYSHPGSHCVHRHPYTPYNQSLTIANQVAPVNISRSGVGIGGTFKNRYVSLCACNSANLICRSHTAGKMWCPSNSTCSQVAPAIECQFCNYNVKRCPGKCQTPRKCHPLC